MTPNMKRDNEESEDGGGGGGGGGGDLSKANWSKETLHLYYDLCIQYAERG